MLRSELAGVGGQTEEVTPQWLHGAGGDHTVSDGHMGVTEHSLQRAGCVHSAAAGRVITQIYCLDASMRRSGGRQSDLDPIIITDRGA